jgi:Zn-dependent protease with chaperone function
VAGHTPEDAVLVITAGALDLLSRDELQAVIAHEFSHLLNGDMRLNLRLIALLAGMGTVAVVATELFLGAAGDGDEVGCLVLPVVGLLGLPLLLVGLSGMLFGTLIQRAVCRQREHLADASAVQFTRHPESLIGAFRKIEGGSSQVRGVRAGTVEHLFIASARKRRWIPLLRTHPSLRKRIKRIENLTLAGPPEDPPLIQATP